MVRFRRSVEEVLGGQQVSIPQIVISSAATPGSEERRPTVRRGSTRNFVQLIQRYLGLTVDGVFGGDTDAAVRELQRRNGLVPDAFVGPKTWQALDHLIALSTRHQ